MRTAVSVIALASALVIVSLSPLPSGATSRPHKAQTLKAEYLAAANKLNKSQLVFNSLTTNTPISTITKAALNLAAAFSTFSNALNHIHFAHNTRRDVRNLETHMQANAAYLRSITVQTASTIASWDSQLIVTMKSATSAINAVRHDLGLSATSLSTSTTTTTTTTTPVPPATISVPSTTTTAPSLTVKGWFDQYDPIIQQFSNALEGWIAAVEVVGNGGNTSNLTQACQVLTTALSVARNDPPVPDTTAESDFQAAINDTATGLVTGCGGSTDFGVLSEGHASLAEGQNDMLALSSRLEVLLTADSDTSP